MKMSFLLITLQLTFVIAGTSAAEASRSNQLKAKNSRSRAVYAQRSDESSLTMRNPVRDRREAPPPSMKIVPSIGYIHSTIDLDIAPPEGTIFSSSTTGRAGLNLGLLFEFGSDVFQGQTGVVYFQEGFKIFAAESDSKSQTTLDADMRIDYVGIPLIGKVNASLNSTHKLYAKAGVVPAYLTGVKSDMHITLKSGTDVVMSKSFASYNKSSMREFNIYGQGGVGYQFGTDSSWQKDLRIEFLYSHAFLNAGSEEGETARSFSSFMVNAAMGFGL